MDTKNLTLPNDVQEVPRLAAFVEDICEVAGIDMGTTMKMNLAIEEAVVNVMNYAYPSGVGVCNQRRRHPFQSYGSGGCRYYPFSGGSPDRWPWYLSCEAFHGYCRI